MGIVGLFLFIKSFFGLLLFNIEVLLIFDGGCISFCEFNFLIFFNGCLILVGEIIGELGVWIFFLMGRGSCGGCVIYDIFCKLLCGMMMDLYMFLDFGEWGDFGDEGELWE